MAIPPVSPGLCHGLRRITVAGLLQPPRFPVHLPAAAVCTNMSSTVVGGASDTEAPFRG
jgi:hypothetical protein